MLHNIKYFFKILLKEKETLFWTFVFPIILGTFFYLTMSNIQNANFIVPVNLAVISNKIDFKDIDKKNEKKEKDRLEENKKELEDSSEDKDYTAEKENFKNKINKSLSKEIDEKFFAPNKSVKDILKEKYDKEQIILDIFSEMAYEEKYIDLKKIEDKDIKKLKNKKDEIEKEYKSFKKEKDKIKEKEKDQEAKSKTEEIKLNEKRIFNIIYVKNEEVLKKLLDEEIVVGICRFEDGKPKLEFKKSGLYETIARSAVGEIYEKLNGIEKSLEQKADLIESDIKKGFMVGKVPTKAEIEDRVYSELENVVNEMINAKSNLKVLKHNSPDLVTSYYYTLIAMTILYQSIFMIYLTENFIPNRAPRSARVSMSVTPKIVLIISGFFVSFILQLIGIGILILFLKFVVKINVIYNVLKFILIILISTVFASTLGFFASNMINKKAEDVQSITIGFIMIMSMCAGMMSHSFKYAIDKNVPIVNKINPAALIVEAIYSSSNVESAGRLYKSLGILSLIGLILFGIGLTLVSKRRKNKI